VRHLSIRKDIVAVLDDELYSIVFRMHVSHFPFQTVVSHDGRRKDDGKVFRSHLIIVSRTRGATRNGRTY
jgi:hypothetical protein